MINVINWQMKVCQIDKFTNFIWKMFKFVVWNIEFSQIWKSADLLPNIITYNVYYNVYK